MLHLLDICPLQTLLLPPMPLSHAGFIQQHIRLPNALFEMPEPDASIWSCLFDVFSGCTFHLRVECKALVNEGIAVQSSSLLFQPGKPVFLLLNGVGQIGGPLVIVGKVGYCGPDILLNLFHPGYVISVKVLHYGFFFKAKFLNELG